MMFFFFLRSAFRIEKVLRSVNEDTYLHNTLHYKYTRFLTFLFFYLSVWRIKTTILSKYI